MNGQYFRWSGSGVAVVVLIVTKFQVALGEWYTLVAIVGTVVACTLCGLTQFGLGGKYWLCESSMMEFGKIPRWVEGEVFPSPRVGGFAAGCLVAIAVIAVARGFDW